jgi:hypothetical protein
MRPNELRWDNQTSSIRIDVRDRTEGQPTHERVVVIQQAIGLVKVVLEVPRKPGVLAHNLDGHPEPASHGRSRTC